MSNMKEGADKKPEKAGKKPNIFVRAARRIIRWFREMRSELKKVVWPTPKQALNNTIIVIISVIIVGAFIWLFDWVAGSGVSALISAFE